MHFHGIIMVYQHRLLLPLSGQTLTLAGTPTTNINTTTLYTYTVTTTGAGTCITETVTGTITLHPDHKITKRGADNDTQTGL